MSFANKQRNKLIKLKGDPVAMVNFDVFDDGSLSMWTHFNHSSDYKTMKKQIESMRDHLDKFINDSCMCPFNTNKE